MCLQFGKILNLFQESCCFKVTADGLLNFLECFEIVVEGSELDQKKSLREKGKKLLVLFLVYSVAIEVWKTQFSLLAWVPHQ